MRRTPLHRLGLLLTAVFQLLLPTFASVADARAEGASERGAVVHVESHSTSHCVPVHSADCIMCRVIAGAASVSRVAAVAVVPTRLIGTPVPQYDRPAIGTSAPGDPSQRAPPAV